VVVVDDNDGVDVVNRCKDSKKISSLMKIPILEQVMEMMTKTNCICIDFLFCMVMEIPSS
jgi:hypothetical protein